MMRTQQTHGGRGVVTNDDVDLSELSFALNRRFKNEPPVGYSRGRAALEDAVVEKLGCTPIRAEQLVRALVEWGFIRFDGDSREIEGPEGAWQIVPYALS
jgi:hypothetical protein